MGSGPSKDELLYQEVQNGNHGAVKSLRRNGASLEWLDKEGRTPLILACTRGELLDMAVTLLNLGADIEAYRPGSQRGTPLHHAAKRGLEKTVTLLLSRGANPLTINDEGLTPLQMARNKGHVSVVRLLEEHLCTFSGTLREISGPRILEAIALNFVTKKIWAVVLPSESNPRRPPQYELAVYLSAKVAQPKVVIPLSKAEIKEPNFNVTDPMLYITDENTKTKYKFLSEQEGNKTQIEKLYKACKGVITADPSSQSAPSTSTSSSHGASPLNQREDYNGWGSTSSHSQDGCYNGWGPSYGKKKSENQPKNTNYGGWEEQLSNNGWTSTEARPSTPQSTLQESTTLLPQPSAPPFPEESSVFSMQMEDLPVNSQSNSNSADNDNLHGMCVICLDSRAEGACVPCGHLAGCMACLTEIQVRGWGCPVCRVQVQQIIKVYAV